MVVVLVLGWALMASGCGPKSVDPLEEVPLSVDPSTVPAGTPALMGRVVDYETGRPISGAFISSAPPTEIVRTTERGEFALLEDVQVGELYRIYAEASGYADQYVTVQVLENHMFVDIALVDEDRSMPVVFDPLTGVFSPSQHQIEVSMFSRSEDDLEWSFLSASSWLRVEPDGGSLGSFEVERLRLSLEPEEFAAALGQADYLQGRVEVQDQRNRAAVLYVIALPAAESQLSFEVGPGDEVDVGSTLSLQAEVAYDGTRIAGAVIEAEVLGGPGLAPTGEEFVAGSNGRATIELEASLLGEYQVRFRVPAYEALPVVERTVTVVLGDNPCALNNGGCGDYAACEVGDDGSVICVDIDFCEVDGEGENYCGVAIHWHCEDQDREAPICTDIDHCEEGDHDCDLEVEVCVNQIGAPALCEPIDFPEVEDLVSPLSPTNQTTASFSFGCSQAGCSFHCTLRRTETGLVISQGSCESPLSYPSLEDGDYEFTVYAEDSDGNRGESVIRTFTIDTVAPVVQDLTGPPAVTAETTAVLEFGCSKEGCEFQCELGRESGGQSTVVSAQAECETGVEFPFLGDGHYTFTVFATDPAGNESALATYEWQVTTVVPEIVNLQGPPLLTTDRSPTFTWGCSETDCEFVCEVSQEGSPATIGPASCDSPMGYSELVDGVYTFEVYAVIEGTVMGPPAEHTWTIDNAQPLVIDLQGPPSATNETGATFTFGCSKAGCSFGCELRDESDAVLASDEDCESGVEFTGLADGMYTFSVVATDTLGTEGPAASLTWTVDTVAPTVILVDVPPAISGSTEGTFGFECSKAGCTFECELDGELSVGPVACLPAYTFGDLEEGEYTFSVVATDGLGNVGETTTYQWSVELGPPEVTITSGPESLGSATTVTLEFECSKSSCEFQCELSGAQPEGPETCESPWQYVGLGDGEHTFEVFAIDDGGTAGPVESLSFEIDTEVPEIEFLAAPAPVVTVDGAFFAWQCTNKPTCTFRCALDMVDPGGEETIGEWGSCASPESFFDLDEGVYTFRVEATDHLGLTSVTPYEWEVIDPAWVSVSSGTSHSCGVTNAGGVRCWGAGGNGRLGVGDTDLRRTPALVGADGEWASVSAGSAHTCGIKQDGSLWCWGAGESGRLGIGSSPVSQLVPAGVGEDNDWEQVDVYGTHSCGIRTDGTLWCWGSGAFGRLGLDDGNQSHNTPQQVGEDNDWVQVATGIEETCAIREDTTLWCWGRGSYGAIGNGSELVGSTSPIQVGLGTPGWLDISMGFSGGCGIRQSPLEGNALYCWGRNDHGRVGNGTTSAQVWPVKIHDGTMWAEVSVRNTVGCARELDQTVWCWGGLYHGQSGNLEQPSNQLVPAEMESEIAWTQLAVGNDHVCAMGDEELYCWGRDFSGELGLGTPAGNNNTPVEMSTVEQPEVIRGGRENGCMVADDGTLWCWGLNTEGKLGTGDPNRRPFPAQVGEDDNWVYVSTSMTAGTSASFSHTCGLKDDGTIWCWGSGNSFRLGLGNLASHWTPQRVDATGEADWWAISAGGTHTCAIRGEGELYCWGNNVYGQTGLGSGASTPQRVGDDLWKAVTAGYRHTCGIQDDDTLWCWGHGGGRLGLEETTTNQSFPQPVGPDEEWVWTAVTSLFDHTCALQDDQTLWCWGLGGNGRLGLGNTSTATTPQQLPGVWIDVAAGGAHTCGVQVGGTAYCWGSSSSGQVGAGSFAGTNTEPVALAGDNWVSIAAGGSFSFGAREEGGVLTMWAWGNNEDGQRGDSTGLQMTPVLVDRP